MVQQRNERADRIGWILQHQTAVLITAWLAHMQEQMQDQTGVYPSGGSSSETGKVSGAGATVWVPEDEHGSGEHIPVTSVEAVVMRGELMRDRREEIRDRLDGIIISINSLNKMLRAGLKGTAALHGVPELCDGRAKGYEGHMLAWVPYSRLATNGWHSPACRDIAGATGLCDACLVRMNRWRLAHGMEPIAVQDAVEVAA